MSTNAFVVDLTYYLIATVITSGVFTMPITNNTTPKIAMAVIATVHTERSALSSINVSNSPCQLLPNSTGFGVDIPFGNYFRKCKIQIIAAQQTWQLCKKMRIAGFCNLWNYIGFFMQFCVGLTGCFGDNCLWINIVKQNI